MGYTYTKKNQNCAAYPKFKFFVFNFGRVQVREGQREGDRGSEEGSALTG